jgi:hypothetical protein
MQVWVGDGEWGQLSCWRGVVWPPAGHLTACSLTHTNTHDTGIYGSQGRDDFTADDVEHYFNYMGMLAVEGSYDRMEEMMSQGVGAAVCVA